MEKDKQMMATIQSLKDCYQELVFYPETQINISRLIRELDTILNQISPADL